MLKTVALVLAVVIFGLVILVSSRPATYHVERSATLNAPPEAAYALVHDFHQWQGWSPWAKLDLAMQTNYSGPAAGVGASYSWTGNKQVGEGRMTITDAQPGERLAIRLEFLKPWKSTNATLFTFVRQGQGSVVTWAMDGENNFASKAFSFFSSMDKMLGPDFERGLAQLKLLAEAAAPKPALATTPPPPATTILPAPLPAVLPAPANTPAH
jgi:uncharacterized protein YndB with AHSA1/START domain